MNTPRFSSRDKLKMLGLTAFTALTIGLKSCKKAVESFKDQVAVTLEPVDGECKFKLTIDNTLGYGHRIRTITNADFGLNCSTYNPDHQNITEDCLYSTPLSEPIILEVQDGEKVDTIFSEDIVIGNPDQDEFAEPTTAASSTDIELGGNIETYNRHATLSK